MSDFTVLWDNDGVLVDTEGVYFEATRDVLARIGFELTLDRFVDYSLRRGRSVFELAARNGAGYALLERLREERNRRYADLLRASECTIDGTMDALEELHGKVGLGIVTSSRRDHLDVVHERSGLLKYFDFVLTRGDYDRSKPHPDPYLAALRSQGLNPERCVVVEDSERGLLAAVAAGLRCLIVPNELTRDGDFHGAHKVLGSVREVPAEVFRLARLPAPSRGRGSAPA